MSDFPMDDMMREPSATEQAVPAEQEAPTVQEPSAEAVPVQEDVLVNEEAASVQENVEPVGTAFAAEEPAA